jgi:MFS transporter, MHS family, alpha-ketoglutarate permease
MTTAAIGAKPLTGFGRLKSILGGCAGNLVEWYDWNVYAYFSLYFAKSFFPKGDATAQLLGAAAVLAVGFLMRPVGAWLMGAYADRRGRKAALTLSVTLMCLGSLVIGLTPTHATLGYGAAVILVGARMVQGLSLGGEYGASATYLSEVASRKWRGFWGSFHYVTLIMGQLTAVGVLLILQSILTSDQLDAFGWRIPFLIGAALAVTVFWLRRSMPETEAFEAAAPTAEKRSRTMLLFLHHPKETLMVMGLTAGGSLSFYVYTNYMQKFLANTAGYTKETASQIVAVALFIFMFMQPAFGALSDKIGRRPMLITFGVLATLCPWPVMTTIARTDQPVVTLGLLMIPLTIMSFYSAISGLFKAELFPIGVRALGVALPYALANSLFGGSAEYVALWFKNSGGESTFYLYVSAVVLVGLVISVAMRDTRTHSRIDHD